MAGRFDRRDRRHYFAKPVGAALRPLFLRPAPQAVAGLAQSRHTGPLDDSGIEAEIRQVRDMPAASTHGGRRVLSIPARAWLAVGAAAILWLLIGLALLIVF